MRSVLLISPLFSIPKSVHSHKAAQAIIYADQLAASGVEVDVALSGRELPRPIEDYEVVFIYHGNDWSGGLNLFGGLNDMATAKQLALFSKTKAKIVWSLGIEYPNYVELFTERFKGEDPDTLPGWDEVDWENLMRVEGIAKLCRIPRSRSSHKVTIGDSHAISLYAGGGMVMNSIPYKTLHGALDIGLRNLLEQTSTMWDTDDVGFYFGNIDVRHHLARRSEQATVDLVRRYVDQAKELADDIPWGIKLYEPLPIENPSRQVPKSGWYKGTPFYGTWAERDHLRRLFVEELQVQCEKTGGRVRPVNWTDYLRNSTGELDFKHMEKPRSVHLSRASYPYWQGLEWNDKSSNNSTLEDALNAI